MLLISAAVQLWIEPLLANNFNRLSWISPVANLLIVPFSSLVLAAGIASALAPDIWSIADSISALAAQLAEWMLALTNWLRQCYAWQRCQRHLLVGRRILLSMFLFSAGTFGFLLCVGACCLSCLREVEIVAQVFNGLRGAGR
jgi:hypothetical protein